LLIHPPTPFEIPWCLADFRAPHARRSRRAQASRCGALSPSVGPICMQKWVVAAKSVQYPYYQDFPEWASCRRHHAPGSLLNWLDKSSNRRLSEACVGSLELDVVEVSLARTVSMN